MERAVQRGRNRTGERGKGGGGVKREKSLSLVGDGQEYWGFCERVWGVPIRFGSYTISNGRNGVLEL